ncbi:hypothetical protein QTP86_014280 [Hemibagrus guttatus]|nr:hypothetical protein QTP86_014280 [Hemibagrus guttatus]
MVSCKFLRIMKYTHKLLFALCPMLVLVFIYYSSGKLHLHLWGHKSHVAVVGSSVSLKIPKAKVIPKVTTGLNAAETSGAIDFIRTFHVIEPEMVDIVSKGQVVDQAFDNQGFLLTLDAKLPVELVHQYGNLSTGSCRPGYAAAKMTAIFPKFIKPAPMFLDRNFKRLSKLFNFLPPFGLKTQVPPMGDEGERKKCA